jgi:predicted transcriptional regulator
MMSAIDSTTLVRSIKEQVRVMLDGLPEDCTFEDVQYGLFVLETIKRGKDEINRGEGIPHEEVERRMQQSLTK